MSTSVASKLLPAEAVASYLLLNFSAVQLDQMAKDRFTITDATMKCVPDDDVLSPVMRYVSEHVEDRQNVCYVQLLVRDYLYKRRKRTQLAVANQQVATA